MGMRDKKGQNAHYGILDVGGTRFPGPTVLQACGVPKLQVAAGGLLKLQLQWPASAWHLVIPRCNNRSLDNQDQFLLRKWSL